ncbi:hypothetical protein K0M31_007577 [Melipona bicolor]|uniref:Uncharacterized protein n=1 Tax=Melipona bicolor TaxID=60889 RepID=A0AA40KVY3_9HYME|nr:hypothetical protein K0M31_007577 [Melipona bicolor]
MEAHGTGAPRLKRGFYSGPETNPAGRMVGTVGRPAGQSQLDREVRRHPCDVRGWLNTESTAMHADFWVLIADDNRDLNDHPEDDLKRQRSNYNGDQLYSNHPALLLQLWSSKWSIKDEHKLLSELGGGGGGGASGGGGGGGGGGTNGTGTGGGGGGGGGSGGSSGGGGGGGGGGYYEHGGFPGNAIATSAELYDSLGTISTMTQAQTPHLYTPPIGGTIGERLVLSLFNVPAHPPFFSH